jgi:hypothetical protein
MHKMNTAAISRWLGVVTLAITLASCNRVQPIYDVPGHSIPAASRDLNSTQITEAIIQTAQTDGWLVERMSATEIRATDKWKGHAAVVIISHDGKTFSIRNGGSTNLLQANGNIHKAYNERVRKLEAEIERRLYRNP